MRNLAKVDLATGLRVAQFDPPALNGRVHDLQLRNGKLYLTGRFTMAGGEPRTLLAAVDPTTGALDPDVRADFTDPRRDSFLTINSSDVSPDGTRMVVTGNFTKINGLGRYQIALLDLTTSPVSVADWQTGLYGDGCANAFKTYMRDVDFSPDGTSFAVVTTGAYNSTFLCDTAAAWDTTATGSNLQPEWVNYSGGDTLTAVAWTDTAVYIGGHQRWANNPYAADRVGAGAVPREGLAALDPRSGATLTWNPGRTRGVAVYSLVATDAGLWIGSDTDRIAGFQYRGPSGVHADRFLHDDADRVHRHPARPGRLAGTDAGLLRVGARPHHRPHVHRHRGDRHAGHRRGDRGLEFAARLVHDRRQALHRLERLDLAGPGLRRHDVRPPVDHSPGTRRR